MANCLMYSPSEIFSWSHSPRSMAICKPHWLSSLYFLIESSSLRSGPEQWLMLYIFITAVSR